MYEQEIKLTQITPSVQRSFGVCPPPTPPPIFTNGAPLYSILIAHRYTHIEDAYAPCAVQTLN